jgi:hypothetical protein
LSDLLTTTGGSIDYNSDWSPSTLSEEQLVAILQFCQLWMIEAGVNFAIHGLKSLDLRPSRMLQYGRQFSIINWIGPAVITLLHTPLRDIPNDAVKELELIAFETIMRAKDVLEQERKLIAAVPPALVEVIGCNSHDRCHKAWIDTWFKVIGRELLHPSKPLPIHSVISRVIELPYNGLSTDCKGDTVLQMTASGIFGIEETITQGAITKILERYGFVPAESTHLM